MYQILFKQNTSVEWKMDCCRDKRCRVGQRQFQTRGFSCDFVGHPLVKSPRRLDIFFLIDRPAWENVPP